MNRTNKTKCINDKPCFHKIQRKSATQIYFNLNIFFLFIFFMLYLTNGYDMITINITPNSLQCRYSFEFSSFLM